MLQNLDFSHLNREPLHLVLPKTLVQPYPFRPKTDSSLKMLRTTNLPRIENPLVYGRKHVKPTWVLGRRLPFLGVCSWPRTTKPPHVFIYKYIWPKTEAYSYIFQPKSSSFSLKNTNQKHYSSLSRTLAKSLYPLDYHTKILWIFLGSCENHLLFLLSSKNTLQSSYIGPKTPNITNFHEEHEKHQEHLKLL